MTTSNSIKVNPTWRAIAPPHGITAILAFRRNRQPQSMTSACITPATSFLRLLNVVKLLAGFCLAG